MLVRKAHDALFKAAFGAPEHARSLFRAVLPADIQLAVAWDTLAAEPGSFIDPRLGERQTDLLFSAQIGGQDALLYVLLEHQSTRDRLMPLRMLDYVIRISRDYAREHHGQLPLVIPVLLTHVPGGWCSPVSYQELIVPAPSSVPGLEPFVPHFTLFIDDLSHLSNRDIRNRALADFPTVVIWALRDSRNLEELIRNFAHWAGTLRQALRAPNGVEAVGQLLRYFYAVVPQSQRERFCAIMLEHIPEVDEVELTIGEALVQEGVSRGIAQGIERGIEQGREQGRQQTLARQLELKFGPLSWTYAVRLQTATSEQLDAYTEAILFATSIEDVFQRG